MIPVPCLRDNYAYLVFVADGDGKCLVVDPGEARPVLAEVERRGLELSAIFNTHHHWDHVGGNLELLSRLHLDVFGHESEKDRIPGLSVPLADGERFSSVGATFSVLHVPGHTSGALALCTEDRATCFTGDTLFCGGCGRLFEGSPEQMHRSLNVVLGALPYETTIYCGHEYTEQNLRFAQSVDDSDAVQTRLEDVVARRRLGEFCARSTLGVERETNPFLRCHVEAVRHAVGDVGSDVEVFARLREMKDAF